MKNLHDNMCFKWAILSALFPASQHADCLSKYVSHKNYIDCSSLQFPVDPKQFSDFERDNPETKRISLLLLDSPDGRDAHHYESATTRHES